MDTWVSAEIKRTLRFRNYRFIPFSRDFEIQFLRWTNSNVNLPMMSREEGAWGSRGAAREASQTFRCHESQGQISHLPSLQLDPKLS